MAQMRPKSLREAALAACLGLAIAGSGSAMAADAAGTSGLPLPRFVSLKADRVNVRKGPGTDYPIAWVFERAGLPVEVVREYGIWRQIRDSDGSQGWVLQNLLSGRRTAIVAPWDRKPKDKSAPKGKPIPVHSDASDGSSVTAYAEAGTLAGLIGCDTSWCEVSIADRRGYVEQSKLWGVYKDEKVE
ncbi:MAG: SH3 domain-containing protein [Hyphomicrobiaceae bacterium]